MNEMQPTKELVIRLASPEDVTYIEELDRLSTSPTRDIHREMEKYFGSIDPSTHERTFIFLASFDKQVIGKAELMVPPLGTLQATGYIKRVVVHPDHRGQGISRQLMQHVLHFAHHEQHLHAVDLMVWEENIPAIHLYESLGFKLQHRELYYRLPL